MANGRLQLPGVNADQTTSIALIDEIDSHLHSNGRWCETATAPSGTAHVADSIGDGAGAFRIDAGNNTWGAWVQIVGSTDTPMNGGTSWNIDTLTVSAAERSADYFMQISFGATGAAGLAADAYSEVVYRPLAASLPSWPVLISMTPQDTGVLGWARCMCPGQNTATLDFYFGIHEE